MSRPKRHTRAEGEEDATKLVLGPDFDDAHTLNICEVKFLLDQRIEARGDKPSNEVFKKTYDFVDTFAKFHGFTELERVNQILQRDPTYKSFELAQLANLVPSDAEEAKALVPSLAERDDDTLQSLLSELDSVRQMGGS